MSDTPITEQVPQQDADSAPDGAADDAAQEADGDTDEPDDWRGDFDPQRAQSRIRKLQNEAKNLRERAKTAEKAVEDVSEKDRTIQQLQADNLRLQVGYELGLPHKLAARLSGATRDELIADAQELLQLVGTPAPAPRKPAEALRGGGQPDMPPEETDVDKIGARMFRS